MTKFIATSYELIRNKLIWLLYIQAWLILVTYLQDECYSYVKPDWGVFHVIKVTFHAKSTKLYLHEIGVSLEK